MSNNKTITNNTKSRLGQGISSLLGEKHFTISDFNNASSNNVLPSEKIQKIDINSLTPNRYQPRKYFNEDELKDLANSIKEKGILEPLIVRNYNSDTNENIKYEIIAGERRYRASKIANLKEVPVIVRDMNDEDALSCAIIENIQRSDLSVMEEAESYDSLMKQFNYTQDDVANFVGKSRSHIANLLRLLTLPKEVKELVYQKKISMGHARALVNCDNAIDIANLIIKNNLNVREVESLANKTKQLQKKKDSQEQKNKNQNNTEITPIINLEYIKSLENILYKKLNLKTKIFFNSQTNKGKITIKYNSLDDIKKIVEKI